MLLLLLPLPRAWRHGRLFGHGEFAEASGLYSRALDLCPSEVAFAEERVRAGACCRRVRGRVIVSARVGCGAHALLRPRGAPDARAHDRGAEVQAKCFSNRAACYIRLVRPPSPPPPLPSPVAAPPRAHERAVSCTAARYGRRRVGSVRGSRR